jgi:Ca2+-binding RTX toxin-like protein
MSEIRAPQWTEGSWNLAGTADDDTLYGGKGDNHFDGGAGNDRMYGGYRYMNGSGGNYFDGGAGEDTVAYGGFLRQYEVKFDAASGTYKVGSDTLKNVEYIQFGDVRIKVEDAAHLEGTQHQYTDGDDQLVGNDYGYNLEGGDGNDTFTGNGGDDTLYGGKGEDTAVFRGNRADYDIRFDYNTRQYIVSDHQAGRDGKDAVVGIEHLRFADTTIDLHGIAQLDNRPDDATLARIDGVIEAPPPAPVVDYGDLIAVVGTWDPILVTDGAMEEIYAVATVATMEVSLAAANVDFIALAGVTTSATANTGGFVLDTP